MNNGNKYIDERVIINLLGNVIEPETLATAYFTNDSEMMYKALIDKSNDMSKVKGLLDVMNYNFKGRFVTGKSMLGDIQNQIVDNFMTKDNIDMFETDLMGDPNMFSDVKDNNGNNIDYSSVNKVYPHFNQKKEMLMGLEKNDIKNR
ncbi:MAG: hypothetical protein PHD10_01530 [Bacilli bacterium]|nr:hypothetical protein [Bacilli bacterium]MDD4607804.1 hypothetical protein [Bacilli bacterium]